MTLVLSGVSSSVVFGGWAVTALATLALLLMAARIADRAAMGLAQPAR